MWDVGAPRAYRVRKGARLVGFLGEGPGPFLTATRTSLPAPWLQVARFVSRAPHAEAEIAAALRGAEDFEGALEALRARGLTLERAESADLFGPEAAS